jgi:hypothetical protein
MTVLSTIPMHTSTLSGGLLAAMLLAVPTLAQAGGTDPAPATKPAARIQAPAPQKQGPTQDQLQELRAKKLAKEVFQNAAWTTDFDAAKKDAKAQDKLILVYFTRSYVG